jgi:hypothetical protein
MEDVDQALADSDSSQSSVRHKFSKLEDDKICELVRLHGDNDWLKISSALPGRTPRQCRERYKNYLYEPSTSNAWTFEEEWLLMQKFREFGPDWVKIARFFANRNNISVKNRWTMIVTREHKRWTIPSMMPMLYGMPICPMLFRFKRNLNNKELELEFKDQYGE